MSAPEIRRDRPAAVAEVTALRDRGAAVAAVLDAALAADDVRLPIAPSRWLVVSPRPDLLAGLAPRLRGLAAAVDQTGAHVRFVLVGAGSEDVLARGCRLDLHPARFVAGAVARTIVAQIAVVLRKRDDAPTFEVLAPSTFADSFAHALETMRGTASHAMPEPRP